MATLVPRNQFLLKRPDLTKVLTLLVPRHLTKATPAFEAAARQELGTPLRLEDAEELAWFFRQRRVLDSGGVTGT